MKKTIFLSMMVCAFLSAKAQSGAISGAIVDDAVQGTGNNQHRYVGTWRHNTTTPTFYQSTLSYSSQTGAYVTVTFVGNRVQWYTEIKNTHGIAAVSIDGGIETLVDLHSFEGLEQQRVEVYLSEILKQGTHTFKIRVTGKKNPASTGFYVILDYLIIGQDSPPRDPLHISDTRFGHNALHNLTDGRDNSAFGYYALGDLKSYSLSLGDGNTALGSRALGNLSQGQGNTAVGHNALRVSEHFFTGGDRASSFCTTVGSHSMGIAGYGNTAIGYGAGPGGTALRNTTALGMSARPSAHNEVRIGNTEVESIGGMVSWSTLSDGRFKRDIKEDVSGLEFINNLRPVSYSLDNDAVAKFLGTPDREQQSVARQKPVRQTGFVAQDVDALVKKSGYVFSGVEIPQNENDPYTIRYADFVVPLVKAMQELTAKVEEQQAKMEEQQKEIEALRKLSPATNDMPSIAGIELYQNNPNPFSVDTDITMVLPESTHQANIIVYTLEGKQIKDVTVKQRGQAAVTIQGNELNPGMYLYALIVDGKVIDTKRMILTK